VFDEESVLLEDDEYPAPTLSSIVFCDGDRSDQDFWETAFRAYAKSGYNERAGLCLKEIHDPEFGGKLLYDSSCSGDANSVFALLHNGVDVDYKLEFRENVPGNSTPLMGAVCRGHTDIARALCEHMANVNAANDSLGETPLILAAQYSHTGMMEFLIEKKARLDVVDLLQHTALSWVIRGGKRDKAKYLLSIGAPLGKTALWNAVKSRRPDIVRLVLEHEPWRRNDRDQMQYARSLAVQYNLLEIMGVLDE